MGKYQETKYIHPLDSTKQCLTPFFQEALVEFYNPEKLYVLLTDTVATKPPEGASESNWECLQKRLSGKVEILPIYDIPEKNSPDDIWQIFQKINDCLEEGDSVIFDITHSFRSVPVVALISVSYLRIIRQVKIDGLLYGAFEAKNKEKNETPTYDLLPIVSLLEWTTATDQFIKTGNGESLANLLHSSHPQTEQLAENIKGIAQALQLLRPMDVMKQSFTLTERIEEATPIISKSVPPFSSLLKRVSDDYGKFSLENPDAFDNNAQESLLHQLDMIEWYVDKGQTVQALSLAREWLPSLLCHHFQLDPLDAENNRDEMEILLAGGKRGDRRSKYLEEWKELPKKQRKQLNNLWSGEEYNLANLRNDVLHAGFRKNPRPSEDIIQKTKDILEELKSVSKNWKLDTE